MQGQINIVVCPTGLLIILFAHLLLLVHYGLRAWEDQNGWDLIPALAYLLILGVMGFKLWAKWRSRRHLGANRPMSWWGLGILLFAHFALFAAYFAKSFAQEEYMGLIGAFGYLCIFLFLYYRGAQTVVHRRNREKRKNARDRKRPRTEQLGQRHPDAPAQREADHQPRCT